MGKGGAAIDEPERLFLIYQSVHGIFISGGNSRKTLLRLRLRLRASVELLEVLVEEGKDMWMIDILTGIFSLALGRCVVIILPFSLNLISSSASVPFCACPT